MLLTHIEYWTKNCRTLESTGTVSLIANINSAYNSLPLAFQCSNKKILLLFSALNQFFHSQAIPPGYWSGMPSGHLTRLDS